MSEYKNGKKGIPEPDLAQRAGLQIENPHDISYRSNVRSEKCKLSSSLFHRNGGLIMRFIMNILLNDQIASTG